MSLFGYETYYICGDVNVDGSNEGHAYNIVADKRGQKCLVDYSITSALEYNGTSWDIPTMAKIDNFDSFTAGNHLRTNNYRYVIQDDDRVIPEQVRTLEYRIMN